MVCATPTKKPQQSRDQTVFDRDSVLEKLRDWNLTSKYLIEAGTHQEVKERVRSHRREDSSVREKE